jgi:putative ABC transport system substrate-binding protein
MNRRRFLQTLSASLLAAPLAAEAQRAGGLRPRIGVLLFTPITQASQEAFRDGLREHGYVEGQNIVVDWRSAAGRSDRADTAAADLVGLNVNVIVAEFTPAIQAAKKATQTIPIVMASAGDPVGAGLVASLARPGGNITGFSNMAAELSGKRLELLRELVPGLLRVGLLIHGGDPLDKAFVEQTQAAATNIGVQLSVVRAPNPESLDAAFGALTKARAGAVMVQANLPVPVARPAQMALRHRLPSISLVNQFPEAGGLVSYGANRSDILRRTTTYVDISKHVGRVNRESIVVDAVAA